MCLHLCQPVTSPEVEQSSTKLVWDWEEIQRSDSQHHVCPVLFILILPFLPSLPKVSSQCQFLGVLLVGWLVGVWRSYSVNWVGCSLTIAVLGVSFLGFARVVRLASPSKIVLLLSIWIFSLWIISLKQQITLLLFYWVLQLSKTSCFCSNYPLMCPPVFFLAVYFFSKCRHRE